MVTSIQDSIKNAGAARWELQRALDQHEYAQKALELRLEALRAHVLRLHPPPEGWGMED